MAVFELGQADFTLFRLDAHTFLFFSRSRLQSSSLSNLTAALPFLAQYDHLPSPLRTPTSICLGFPWFPSFRFPLRILGRQGPFPLLVFSLWILLALPL